MFGRDTDGVEYVEFSKERGTKTRIGVEGETSRPFRPRMYATKNWIDAQSHYSRSIVT